MFMVIPWKLSVSIGWIKHIKMIHPTKTLGDLGVLKAQLDLTQKGYIVSRPQTEHAPFDLLITDSKGSRTVQVKARSINASGTVEVRLISTWTNSKGVQRRAVDKRMIDLYCIYCPDTDSCYYIASRAIAKTIKLRVRAPKNGQKKHIRWASDFREVP